MPDAAGRPLYSISSNSKRTKLLSHRDNAEVATIEWDRSSPRMVFRVKKIKCKEWLPLAGPTTEYVAHDVSFRTIASLTRHESQVSSSRAWQYAVHVDAAVLQQFRESFTLPATRTLAFTSLPLRQTMRPALSTCASL